MDLKFVHSWFLTYMEVALTDNRYAQHKHVGARQFKSGSIRLVVRLDGRDAYQYQAWNDTRVTPVKDSAAGGIVGQRPGTYHV